MIIVQDFENSKDLEELLRRKSIVFASLRGTPAYWERMKSRIRHMIAMKGAPTAFATFSSADNFWPDIERCFDSYVLIFVNNSRIFFRIFCIIFQVSGKKSRTAMD